ncbi:MAG: cyclic nucleotide-binding domain-containing protein [Candidatus Cloacimonadota bacterium]|nr:cyclic nucleotide-binding domain-containing protein [Candidatus Cloacimonadota bacterium]
MGFYSKIKARLHKSSQDKLKDGSNFFQNLSVGELKKFKHLYFERKYTKGEILFKEDYPHAVLYIIKSGSISITINTKEGAIELTKLYEGDYFGELGLFIDSLRTADVVAIEDCTLYAVSKNLFKTFIEKHPRIGSKILYSIAQKLSKDLTETNKMLKKNDI